MVIIYIIIYIIITFFLLQYIYNRLKIFYQPLKYKDPETGKEIDINDKYDAFRPYDPINYYKFIFSGLFLFPIRSLLCFLDCVFYLLNLKLIKIFYKNTDTNSKEAEIISNIAKFWSKLFLKICGISLNEIKLNYEETYKKYLGPDYNFQEEKYSIIISNHLGYYDVVANMAINGSGFLAMQTVGNAPIGGDIAANIGSIFVDRSNEQSRKNSFEKILERQKNFYNGKNFNKLLVFPEGTTTNNRYVTTFKKGVFVLLLPIKPMIMFINYNDPCQLCVGVVHLFFHVLRSFCYLTNQMSYCSLPVIKPTQFMFENYKNLGKEKWEIYLNVVYKMYLEIGKFKETHIGLRDKNDYYEACETGVFKGIKLK